MAQTVENKLTENEERNVKREQILDTLRSNMQKIIQELGLNRVSEQTADKALVPTGQKSRGQGGYVKF